MTAKLQESDFFTKGITVYLFIRYSNMRIVILILICLLTKATYGQYQPTIILKIDSIAKTIDSTKNLDQAVSDGVFKIKGKKGKGAYSDWYYRDSLTKHLVKVFHEEAFQYDDYWTYYFHNDSLILVTTKRAETIQNIYTYTSTGRYYFQNDQCIYRKEEGTPVKKPELFLQNAKQSFIDQKAMFLLPR